jgi:hypothetical protein
MFVSQGSKPKRITVCDHDTICFTICLFISPDLDGHRAPKMKYCPTDMFHDMFTALDTVSAIMFTICHHVLGTGIWNHRASEYSCSAKTTPQERGKEERGEEG